MQFGHPRTRGTCPGPECPSTTGPGQTERVTDAPAASPPSKGRHRTRRLQPHHVVFTLLLVVVAACVVVLFLKASQDDDGIDNQAIERLIPLRDAKILQQETIGIDLAPGYEGTLALNGTPIPEDQLTVVPQLNQVTFTPGPGKDYEQLPSGQSCLVATYWQSSTPAQTNTQTWCFTVL